MEAAWRTRSARLLDLGLGPAALVLGFGGGLLLAILAQGSIELVAYGRPFHSLLASFEYNVTSGLAPVEFGKSRSTGSCARCRRGSG